MTRKDCAVIDFHTHAFPDKLAHSTIALLEEKGEIKACLDGTLDSLLDSMEKNHIEKSVLCNIATRPEQFGAILAWSRQIASDKILPLPSFHPDSENAEEEIDEIYRAGFKGIKMHPYYQNFYLDEERLRPLFARIAEKGLILVMHTGYDIGFPLERRADPAKVLDLTRRFPDLKFIATHLGSWQQWDEVKEYLAGRDIYMEISFSLELLEPEQAREIIEAHPEERILFGTDSPWTDQKNALRLLKNLGLAKRKEEAILYGNASKLLDLD